ncbi:hypothetical protein L6R52_12215 [Myxococcota bacterium]|nr:hypothetical protein [Myxococcota bacterium]
MKRTVISGLGVTAMALFMAACAGDTSRTEGGGSVSTGESFAGLYVASGSDSIARVDLDGRATAQIQVGREPTRIARFGGRVYVTLRAERKVAVYEDSGDGLRPVGAISTGAEPYGVVATKDRIYVSSSVAGYVAEYDAASHAELRKWSLAGEPRWLTMHPNGRALYVGSAYGGHLVHIDLDSGVARDVALPNVQSFNFRDGTPIELAKRITSDVVFSPSGDAAYVGMLYLDNVTPIPDAFLENGEEAPDCNGNGGRAAPPPPTEPGMDPGTGEAPVPVDCGGGGGYDNQKFNPVITAIGIDPGTGAPVEGIAEAINIVGFANVEDAAGNVIGGEAVSGYPAALSITADGAIVFAAIEGAEAVVAMLAQAPGSDATNAGAARVAPPQSGDATAPGFGFGGSFSFRNTLVIKTGAAPRGLGIVNGNLQVHAFFDQKVEEISIDDVEDYFALQLGDVTKTLEVELLGNGVPRQLRTKNPLAVSTEVIDPELDQGRRLFYASNNPLMATVGAGVSCATCHFDARTDGVTWSFVRGPRQTPNLAVDIEHAQPVGWAGNVPTVADEGMSTSQRLMGGQNLTPEHAGAIQKFLYEVRTIDTPNRTATDAQIIRGQVVFANVGCVSCHVGPALTDNKPYAMLGLSRVKTRPLTGIAASAPYFHDGSSATLEDVVERAAKGEMGPAFSISAEDKVALVEYLKSL